MDSEKFWDKTASKYDQLEQRDEPTTTYLIQKTKTYLTPHDTVMDFGCGTGQISNRIAECASHIYALDFSSEMIRIAEQKAADRGISNISFAHSTIMNERYPSGSYDVILACYVLHLLGEEQPGTLQKMYELLRPGGLLITATPCLGEKPLLRSLLRFAGKVGLVPTATSFKLRGLIDTLEQAGFSILEQECLNPRTQEHFIVARKNE